MPTDRSSLAALAFALALVAAFVLTALPVDAHAAAGFERVALPRTP